MRVSKRACGGILLAAWVIILLFGAITGYAFLGFLAWWFLQLVVGGTGAILFARGGSFKVLESRRERTIREINEAIRHASSEKFEWPEDHPNRIAMDTEITNLQNILKNMDIQENNERFGRVSRRITQLVNKEIE